MKKNNIELKEDLKLLAEAKANGKKIKIVINMYTPDLPYSSIQVTTEKIILNKITELVRLDNASIEKSIFKLKYSHTQILFDEVYIHYDLYIKE